MSEVLLNLLASVFVVQVSCFLRYVLVEGVQARLLKGIMVVFRVSMQLAVQIVKINSVFSQNFMIETMFDLGFVSVGMGMVMDVFMMGVSM